LRWSALSSPESVPAFLPGPEERPLTSLELFAGAGGLAIGVHQAGFEHLGLIEWADHAASTLHHNAPRALGIGPERVLHGDARSVDYTRFRGAVDLLSGGPPCQPFSTGGVSAGDQDDRNMFPVFLSAVKTVRPRAVLIENVRGLTRARFSEYFDYLHLRLRFPFARLDPDASWQRHLLTLRTLKVSDFDAAETYSVASHLIDTADFGVPQRRERVMFIALRGDLNLRPALPAPTHGRLALLRDQWLPGGTYWERHGLAPLDARSDREKALTRMFGRLLFQDDALLPWRTTRDAISSLPPPVPRGETPTVFNHVQHPGARLYPPAHVGSFPDLPAKALKAGTHGMPGGENILNAAHEGVVRYFTTREAARLHTFPDDWEFQGTWGACIKQLGNAVPVELGRVYASAIHAHLRSAPERAGEDASQP